MNKPSWWPENPYPKGTFSTNIKDFARLVPDLGARTAITEFMARAFWDFASEDIWAAMIHSKAVPHQAIVCAHCGAFTEALEELWDCGTQVICEKCGEPTVISLETPEEYVSHNAQAQKPRASTRGEGEWPTYDELGEE